MTASSTIALRLYRPDDIPTAADLWYRSWHNTFPGLQHPRPREEWEDRFRELPTTETVWIAEVNGRVAAFLAIREQDGYVHLLYADPDYHGRGVGRALLSKARELCPDGIWLHCVEDNTHARGFYEHHGMIAGEKGLNENTGQTNITYRWTPPDGA